VAQADVSALGTFDFYDNNEVRRGLSVTFTDEAGEVKELVPVKRISGDMEMILAIFRQIFGAVMGDFGENLHYFILRDSLKAGERTVDPYLDGLVRIELKPRSGAPYGTGIELPLNALYVPRFCPNGKEAHISWNYCPWTGVPLED
jgi:hypothetical protein